MAHKVVVDIETGDTSYLGFSFLDTRIGCHCWEE
jgi:hypothetical protein